MLERGLLSAREAAYYLGGVSVRTLWDLTFPRGPIPAVRLGRRVFYRRSDLDKFLEQAVQKTVAAAQQGQDAQQAGGGQ